MNENKTFSYYAFFEKQAFYAHEMAMNLESATRNGELGSKMLMDSMHVIENDADAINHQIQAHLLNDFVVPMERSGLAALAHALDDICDSIEQIVIDAFVCKETELPQGGLNLINCLTESTSYLCEAISHLASYNNNSKRINDLCVAVQSSESKADDLYVISASILYADETLDSAARQVHHRILDATENAVDSVEIAAEQISSIVLVSV